MSRTNDSSDSLGLWHGKEGGREDIEVCAMNQGHAGGGMDGQLRYLVHSSLQRPATHVKGAPDGPVKLVQAERALRVWEQHPHSGPQTTKAQPGDLLRN
jgi:hypothetical protein